MADDFVRNDLIVFLLRVILYVLFELSVIVQETIPDRISLPANGDILGFEWEGLVTEIALAGGPVVAADITVVTHGIEILPVFGVAATRGVGI